jgi:Arc/MetJ family transcription regulator
MRTTLNIDDALLDRARKLTGIQEKTALIHAAIEAMIALESARRLAALGGSQPKLRPRLGGGRVAGAVAPVQEETQ